MRTLFIAYDLPPAPNAGARRIEHLLLTADAALSGRISVACSPEAVVSRDIKTFPFQVPLPSSTDPIVVRVGKELRLGISLIALLRRESFDRVIVSSPLFLPTLAVTAWCRSRSIPYVLDVRDPYPMVYAEAGLVARKGLIYRRLDAMAASMFRGARLVTAATKGLAAEIRLRAPRTPVRPLRNGHSGAGRSHERSDGALFEVFCHGNFGAFQDLDLLIDTIDGVLRSRTDIHFTIVGRGHGMTTLASRAESTDWAGRVHVGGTVPPDELSDVLERADVGLSIRGDDWISRHAFPVRVTDYLDLGIPVLVSPPSEAGALVERLGLGRAFEHDEIGEMVDYIVALASRGPAYQAAVEQAERWGPSFSRSRAMRRLGGYLARAFEESEVPGPANDRSVAKRACPNESGVDTSSHLSTRVS